MASALAQPDVSKLVDLLGSALHSKSGDLQTADVRAKYLGIYFSASWCPPCRAFTPKLVKYYKDFKSAHPSARDFELVFVSSDRSSKDAAKYYNEMPWLKLPYSDRARKEQLAAKCKVCPAPFSVSAALQYRRPCLPHTFWSVLSGELLRYSASLEIYNLSI
jgi:nucleoredoxin